jgi:microcystin-dependent protein
MSFIYNAGKSGIYNESDEFMAGQIAYCAAGVIPSGWLECNGAAISRATYGTLFASIGTNYGAGDGATTFNLPDLRGEFLRGADRGRGVDVGRAVGSAQADMIKSHSHDVATFAGSAGSGVRNGGADGGQFNVGGAGIAAGGTETRPRNVALIPVIKYS